MSYAALGAPEALAVGQPYQALIAQIRQEFPDFKIVQKRDSKLMLAIDKIVRVVTLGQNDRFLSHYATTIGDTVYVGDHWAELSDVEKAILLRHERVHMRQRRELGAPVFFFVWLVPIFPVGLAYGRARLEWAGYKETLRATFELRGAAAAESPTLRKHIVGQFTGPAYGWMWPFESEVQAWYDAALAELRAEKPALQPGLVLG